MGPSQPLAYDWAKSARSMPTSMCIRVASATATAGRRLFFSLAALGPAGDGPDIECSAGAAGIPLIAAKQPAGSIAHVTRIRCGGRLARDDGAIMLMLP